MSVLNTFQKKFDNPIPSYFVANAKRGTAPAAYKIDAIETFINPPARMKYRATASTAAVIVTNPYAMYTAFMALCMIRIFFGSLGVNQKKCLLWVSNPVPSLYKRDALPFELRRPEVPNAGVEPATTRLKA